MEIRINGYAVKIDDEDAGRVMGKKWYVLAERNACGDTSYRVYDTTKLKLPMTRFILGTERLPGLIINHINGDKLDNRKANLRVVTNAQNQMNRKANVGSKLGLKGVRHYPSSGRYAARITKDGVQHLLGNYFSAKSAAIAYDNAARKMFGEYALLNYPEEYLPTPVEDYVTESGEKWIRPKGNGFIVSIKASSHVTGYHSRTFLRLDEAVEHRNTFVMITRDLPRDGKSYSYSTLPEDIRKKLYKENPNAGYVENPRRCLESASLCWTETR